MKNDTTCYRVNVDKELLDNAKEDISSNKETLDNQAKLFSLLGSDVRLKIVYLILKHEKMCVCDLSDVLEMKQSPISQHLRKLKDGGILQNNREGLIIFYSIPSSLKSNIESLIKF
ncbi:MAG: transcriptional regulator [Arcobacter sp.]|nr:MAG: transcriptional regulator [Arcobacter sp.]